MRYVLGSNDWRMCSAPLTVRPAPPEMDTRCEAATGAAAEGAEEEGGGGKEGGGQ